MTLCSQCRQATAVFELNGQPICVHCNLKAQQAFQIHDNMLKEQYNHLLDEAEMVTGLYGVMPRLPIQRPVIHQGSMTFHNIKVDNSVVGAINTGNVKKMEVALNNIHTHNANPELESALKEFTEAVVRETKLSAETRDDVVEQLSVLAAQLARPKESRVTIVMKALVTSIGTHIASTGLEHVWHKILPMIGFK